MFDLIICGANVVTEYGTAPLTVAVKDGKITGLFSPDIPVSGKVRLDYDGFYLLPGVIDPHSHVTYCDTFYNGTRTAASGGITTIIEMPLSLNLPAATSSKSFSDRIRLGESESFIDFALWGGVQPNSINQVPGLFDMGAASLKVFMNYVGEEYQYFDDYSLVKLMEATQRSHGLIGVHAENNALCSGFSDEHKHNGWGAEHYSQSRPLLAEMEAVHRLCFFALQTGCHVHVCHVTAPEVALLILEAQEKGAAVTFETCPHYLMLTQKDITIYGTYAKCNPPIREEAQQDGLWKLLEAENIDCIGSDHSTYSSAQKETRSFWDAPGGFPGMDLLLPILVSEGIHKRNLNWNTLANVTATNTAKIFGLAHQKGSIAIGKDADFAVIDSNKIWTFHASQTYYGSKSEKYPYENRTFKGAVHATLVRGKIIFQNGKITASSGYGRFISSQRGNLP